MAHGPTLFAMPTNLMSKSFSDSFTRSSHNDPPANNNFCATTPSATVQTEVESVTQPLSTYVYDGCHYSPSVSPRPTDDSDDIEILMSGSGQQYTQSDSDVHTPQTTVTSVSSYQARSVPHILNVQFADMIPLEDESKPEGTKFFVSKIPNGKTVQMGESNGYCVSHDPNGRKSPVPTPTPFSSCASIYPQNSSVADMTSEKDHHKAMRDQHRKTRKRHFTDPVDFDGILRIIGGMGWWQLIVFALVSLQQIPHAMLNLSIIFMMFKPDHWCYVSDLDVNSHTHITPWDKADVMNFSIPYDKTTDTYDSCRVYNRDYRELSHLSFLNATGFIESHNETIAATQKCSNWTYDDSVMKNTIVTEWNLVCDDTFRRADAHLAYAVGYFIGCLVSGLCSDRFGRKPTIIGFGVLASVFGLILPYSTYFSVFLLVRFLGAVCNEAADLAAYVLCMEITGTKYRSAVGSLLQLPWALGYVLLVGVAYLAKDWRTIQTVTAVLHTFTVLLICMLPESPRWLIVNNRSREAETIIRKACRMNNGTLPADLELIKHAERRQWVKRNQRASLVHLVKSKVLVYRTLLIFIVWIVTALVYYGVTLNISDQSAPAHKMFHGNFFVNNLIAGAIEIPVLFICILALQAGRKKAQMASLILSGIMMLGVVLSPKDNSWMGLTFMLLGKACIQGAFNILYIFTSEMYPTVIRNSAVGICSMIARLGSGIASYVAILSDVTLPIVPQIIFGVCALAAGGLVIFLPETLNAPLPDTLQDAVSILRGEKYNCIAQPKFSVCEEKELAAHLERLRAQSDAIEPLNG